MPVLFLFVPLAGIFIQNLPNRKTGLKMAPWVAGAVCIIHMVMAASYGASAWQGVATALRFTFGGSLEIDFMGAVILFTTGLVALLASFVAAPYDKLNFSNMVLMAVIGISGTAMVRDLFTLYIFMEITSVSSWVMIAIRKQKDAFEGAFKYLVMSAVATIMMLSAVALIFLNVQALDYASVSHYLGNTAGNWPLTTKLAIVLLMAGFSIKAGVVPFHGWVTGAYTAAPPALSVMLAGIITKAGGVYAILRMMTSVFAGQGIGLPFMVLGAVSIVVGALAAIGQKDMKMMLAWSSISQIGYIVLAAGLGTKLAMAGALLHFFNHAIFKSLLFVNSATLEEQVGTRDMDKLGGLSSRMKITGGTSVVGFLSTAGVPPLSGFWSKLLIIVALWQAGQHFYAAVALMASILTLAYFLIMQRKVFFGKLREGLEEIREGGVKYTVPALILAGITVLAGVLFPFVMQFLQAQGLF